MQASNSNRDVEREDLPSSADPGDYCRSIHDCCQQVRACMNELSKRVQTTQAEELRWLTERLRPEQIKVLQQWRSSRKASIEGCQPKVDASLGELIASQTALIDELQRLRAYRAEQDDQLQRLTVRLEQERHERQTRRLMTPGHDALDTSQVIKSLPEVREAIARAMGKAVPRWIMDVDETCYPQLILPQLFRQCLEEMKKHRQGIVEVFLGKVAGATEESMDPKKAEEMLDHMRRHHKTLFPLTPRTADNTERRKVLDRVFRGISIHLQETLGSLPEPDHHVKWLQESGLEKVVDLYLEIIVNVILQHPSAVFRGDCGDEIQKLDPALRGNDTTTTQHFFNEDIHSGSIDGGRGEDGQYIVVFPALLLESGGEAWTKSYLLESVPQPSSADEGEKNTAADKQGIWWLRWLSWFRWKTCKPVEG